MTTLEKIVKQSSDDLKKALGDLGELSRTSVSKKSVTNWEERSLLHKVLDGTSPLFLVRQKAWTVVEGLAPQGNAGAVEDGPVTYGDVEMEFAIARHLALTSYMTATWAIYDRLTNFCGRVAGVGSIASNPKQNPKLCEDLLARKKEMLGFMGHLHMRSNKANTKVSPGNAPLLQVTQGTSRARRPLF